jgi:hypothetical protein
MLKMSTEMREEWRRNQRPNLIMELGDDCCTDHFNTVALSRTAAGGSNGGDRFLVMGVQRNGQLVPTLILPWTKRSKVSTHTSETSFFKHQQRNKQTNKKTGFLMPQSIFLVLISIGNSECGQSFQTIQLLGSESRFRIRDGAFHYRGQR